MEIYRNETANVVLKVPVTAISGTFEVAAYEGDTLLYTFPTVTQISGGYQVTMPFSLVQADRSFEIRWSFSYLEATLTKTYSATTKIDVVTPYVTLDEIKEAIPEVIDMFTADRIDFELKSRR